MQRDITEFRLNFLSVFSNLGGSSSPFTNEPLQEHPRAGALRAEHPHSSVGRGCSAPHRAPLETTMEGEQGEREGVSVSQGPCSLDNPPSEIISDLHGEHQISLT